MRDLQYQITTAALEAAVEEFSKRPLEIYGGESGFKRTMQTSRNASFRKWSHLKRCSFDNCDAQSIENSHAIPCGMMRDAVTSNGHVMTPERNGAGGLNVNLLGVNDATVFPGFCKKHEDRFSNFEKKKSLDNDDERFLQIYRSTQRELYRARHWYQQVESELNEYIENRNAFLLRRTNELLIKQKGRRLAELPKIKLDQVQLVIQKMLVDLRALIISLETQLLPHAKSCAFSDGSDKSGVIYKTEVPFVIPVALSGSGDFRTTQKQIRVVIGVIPQKEKTNIFMLGAAEDSSVLKDYWKQRTDNSKNLLGMISSWMTHGTDQWYFHPEHWKEISDEIRARIISGVEKNDLNIAAPAENIFFGLEQSL